MLIIYANPISTLVEDIVRSAWRHAEAWIKSHAITSRRELKRDIEFSILTNQGASAGANTATRMSAGMESWIASTDHGGNGMRGTSTNVGSTIGYSSGTVSAPTDGGSFGALSQTTLNAILELAWTDGGNPTKIIVNSTHKPTIDGFTSQATRFVDVDSADQIPILTAANVYVSDFGKHTVMLSRYMRTNPSCLLAIDPDYWATAWLRRPFMEPLAKTGDGEKRQILAEWTLVARNPNSSAKVYGLT